MPRFDDDYDEEDDDRPRRPSRRPEPPPKSNVALVVAVVIAFGILSLGCLGAGIAGFFLFRAAPDDGPQVAVNAAPIPAPARQAEPVDQAPAQQNPVPPAANPIGTPQPQAFPMNPAVQPPVRPAVDRSKPLAPLNPSQPRKPSEIIFGPATPESGTTWRKLAAQTQPNRRDGDTYAGTCWGDGGRTGYVLTRKGVLTRFRHPDLSPDLEVDLGQQCDGLARCNQGLLVTLAQLQEVWVVDPVTLAVKRRAGVSMLQKALTAPGLDVAYAVAGSRGGVVGVVRVGLADGKLTELAVGRVPDARTAAGPGDDFTCAALAPDGRYFYAEVSIEALGRYRIDGDQLSLEEASDPIAQGHRVGICPSPDGRFVCFPAGGGNDGAGGYSTFVYRVGDLRKPAFTLTNDAYPEVVGFDPVGKRVYSQNYDTPLLVFDENGTRRNALTLGGVGGSHNIRGYAPHPGGQAVLVHAAHAVVHVDLSR